MSEQPFYNLNSILTGVRAIAPQEFDRLNRKIYRGVDKFADWRHLFANLATARKFCAYLKAMPDFDRLMAVLQAIVYRDLDKTGVPLYFVEPALLKACLNTELTGTVDWNDMKLPFETGVFILPKNFLLFPDGSECGHLVWSRIPAGEVSFGGYPTLFQTPFFLMFTSSLGGYNLHRVLNAPYEAQLPLELYDFVESRKENSPELLMLSEDEKIFELKLNNLLFNLLKIMTSKESIIKEGTMLGRHKKGGFKSIWTPNLVGADYRIRRISENKSAPSGITQESHWRAGHWRLQHFGKNFSQEKEIWIEPYQTG